MGAWAQRGAGSSGSRAALPMGKTFPTKPSRPRLLPVRGTGTGGDISGGGLGDKVSRSIPGSLRPLPADPNWEYWEQIQGVIPCGAGCHLRSTPSSRAEGVWGSSGIGAVPISSGTRNLGIPGFYKPCQDPTPVWGFLLGILWLPLTSERPFQTSLSTSPSLPSVFIRSPGFSRSNFPDLQAHPFSILSSCLPCNPCNSHGSVPPSSRFPAHPVLAPRWNPALPAIPQSPVFPVFSLSGKSQPFISGVWDVKGLKRFPGSRWWMEFLRMAASLPRCPSSPRFFMELL